MGLNLVRIRIFFFSVTVACLLSPVVAECSTLRVDLGGGRVAALTENREIFLEAQPRPGEGLLGFSRRFSGSTYSGNVEAISRVNGGIERLLLGVRYRIPFRALTADLQLEVLREIFRTDYAVAGGWYHQVGEVSTHGSEGLWHVAEWFTGLGNNYRAIREVNQLSDDDLSPGQLILIPARLLRPALRAALPADSPYYLEYGSDSRGEYAAYRLKPGEALYSSVVIRFTGRIYGEDVTSLAEEIAQRSGISDVRAIPANYRVKIPFDLLLPEFLPATDPRRREYEEGLLASAQYSNPVTATRLRGITVILDAGHGGADVGANIGRVWESVYVYDIMVRTKKLLEETTGANVLVTIRDGEEFDIPDRDVLPQSRGHHILTNPPYPIEASTVGTHLRWYLSNSYFRQLAAAGGDPDRVVFLSIHADSLHPSLRGTMAYIPGARYRAGSFGKSGAVYASRREFNEMPSVSFTYADRVRSEGLSRELANALMLSFEEAGLTVHPDKPVREKIIRKRREWVPAVLRYNSVPAQVLLEVCNLANAEDRELIQTKDFRQKVAERIVEGIVDYYGDSALVEDVQIASAGG